MPSLDCIAGEDESEGAATERHPPAPAGADGGPAPPGDRRDAYADVGLALRYSRDRLNAAAPTSFQRRVWEAVACDLLASWSHLTARRSHLARDVCRLTGTDPESAANRSHVGTALAVLRDAGVLDYRPASGREPAWIALPAPPDEWADPTCGLTAGDLRARRHQGGLPAGRRGGVSHAPGGPWRGSLRGTRGPPRGGVRHVQRPTATANGGE